MEALQVLDVTVIVGTVADRHLWPSSTRLGNGLHDGHVWEFILLCLHVLPCHFVIVDLCCRGYIGGCFDAVVLADALPPLSRCLMVVFGGCFAAFVVMLDARLRQCMMVVFGGCFAVVLLVDAWPPTCCLLAQSAIIGVVLGLFSSLWSLLCYHVGHLFRRPFVSFFSSFSHVCVWRGQPLFGLHQAMYVIAFFLIKYMHKKKIARRGTAEHSLHYKCAILLSLTPGISHIVQFVQKKKSHCATSCHTTTGCVTGKTLRSTNAQYCKG